MRASISRRVKSFDFRLTWASILGYTVEWGDGGGWNSKLAREAGRNRNSKHWGTRLCHPLEIGARHEEGRGALPQRGKERDKVGVQVPGRVQRLHNVRSLEARTFHLLEARHWLEPPPTWKLYLEFATGDQPPTSDTGLAKITASSRQFVASGARQRLFNTTGQGRSDYQTTHPQHSDPRESRLESITTNTRFTISSFLVSITQLKEAYIYTFFLL